MILRVRNWAKYQHYKDRNPPWIKLHFALLSSRDWVMMNDSERVLAVACMLIASQSSTVDGSFDADPEYIKRVAYLHKTPDFTSLIKLGFLEDASDCKQVLADARPEERRGEVEKEKETDAPANPKKFSTKQLSAMPDGFCVSESVKAWALKKGFGGLSQHLEHFELAAAAKNYRYVDWDAAFKKAISDDWAKIRSSGNGKQSASRDEAQVDEMFRGMK